MKRLLMALLALTATGSHGQPKTFAPGQVYPDRPITLSHAYSPGSNTHGEGTGI